MCIEIPKYLTAFIFYINTCHYFNTFKTSFLLYLLFVRKVSYVSWSTCTKSTRESRTERKNLALNLRSLSWPTCCRDAVWTEAYVLRISHLPPPSWTHWHQRTRERESGSEELAFLLTNKQKWPLKTFTSVAMLAFWIMNENVFSGVEKTRC